MEINDLFINDLEQICYKETNLKNCIKNVRNIGKKDLVIIHQNIRSMRKNFDNFLCQIESELKHIDVIILTEIYIKENEKSKYNLPNFELFINPRNTNKAGGLICYVKDNIECKECNINFTNAEIIRIKINNNLIINAIYRPPNSNKLMFIKELKDKMLKNEDTNNSLIIGDINLNLFDQTETHICKYEDKMSKYSHKKLLYYPTREEFRLDKLSSTLIDHIYFKYEKDYDPIKSFVVETKITDHYMIGCIIENKNVQNNHQNVTDFKINYKKLNRLISNFNWEVFCKYEGANEIYLNVKEKLECFKSQCIEEKYNTKGGSKRDKSWCSEKIKICIYMRDRLFRKSKNSPNVTAYREEYKKYRNKVNQLIKNAKIEYYTKKFNNNISNVKKTWEILNNLLGKEVNNIDSIIIKHMSGLYNLNDIVENFAKYFIESVDKIVNNCPIKLCEQIIETPAQQSMFLPKLTCTDTKNILDLLDKNKGPGVDGITMNDIKNGGESMLKCITTLVNNFIIKSEFPKDVKMSMIRPIFKSGKHDLFENYRPVSILNLVEKIGQKHVEIHFTKYLLDFDIIDKNQYAYQKNKSTNLAISEVSNYINSKLAENKHVLCLFVDLSKAFDTVDPDLLCEDLEKIGIRGPVNKLMESMLKQRKMKVKVGKQLSNEKNLNRGVVQGGIMSAKWFLIYINEIANVLGLCKIFMFADDLLIVASDDIFEEAEQKLQTDFDKLLEWSHDKKLIINRKKTQSMYIFNQYTRQNKNIVLKAHSNKCLHNFQINCSCDNIIQVEEYIYLGVIIDNNFNWDKHIFRVINKLRSALYQIKSIKSLVNENILKTVYFSLVHPFILYGITAWGNSKSAELTKLKKLQTRILKAMKKGPKFQSENEIFKYWKILPIDILLKQRILIDKYFDDKCGEPRKHPYETRFAQTNPLQTQRCLNRFHERTWDYVLPRLWNEIPNSLKNLSNRSIVKYKLKKFFESQL
jgi:Reverse transcriptase (RNA-dependent DNA polymerase)